MKKLADLSEMIEEGLQNLDYPIAAATLYDPIRYTLDSGGKRLRPTLVLIAASLYNDDIQAALKPALGIEMYHNFTLLHDDVMDKAPTRRGRPTVHVKWNDNQAILSGDAMEGLAYQLIAEAPSRVLKNVIDTFNLMNQEICQGQQYDMEFETRDNVTIDEYIEMIRLKTSVLLGRALQIGAYIGQDKQFGNLSDIGVERYEWLDRDIDTLFRFGTSLGLAFQLQDDFLDVYGDTKVFGKAIGGDILCNKKTYMLINAFNMANPDQRAQLQHWLSRTDDPQEKIAAVTALYNEIGIDRLAKEKIRYYFEESKKILALVNVPEERKRQLIAYTDEMMQREY